MPAFDVVSEIDSQEMKNAVDQARRELATRYDFRGVEAEFEYQQDKDTITMSADSEFQLQQMLEILRSKMTKRELDVRSLEPGTPQASGKKVRQSLSLLQGLDATHSKKIVKLIKDSKLKVQASIQDKQVRVTGKKRNDLQAIIGLLKESDLDRPLQFQNFRD